MLSLLRAFDVFHTKLEQSLDEELTLETSTLQNLYG